MEFTSTAVAVVAALCCTFNVHTALGQSTPDAEMQFVADDFAKFAIMKHYPNCNPHGIQIVDSLLKRCGETYRLCSHVTWNAVSKRSVQSRTVEIHAEFVIRPNSKLVYQFHFVEEGKRWDKHVTHVARTIAEYNIRLERWTDLNPPSKWVFRYPLSPWIATNEDKGRSWWKRISQKLSFSARVSPECRPTRDSEKPCL